MSKLKLTLACGDYDIIKPLKEGAVEADGIELNVLTAMDSTTRHWRFLRNQDFDVGEVSCSSYIASKDKDFPFEAITVFLHRRFSPTATNRCAAAPTRKSGGCGERSRIAAGKDRAG